MAFGPSAMRYNYFTQNKNRRPEKELEKNIFLARRTRSEQLDELRLTDRWDAETSDVESALEGGIIMLDTGKRL
jgi:hypothetical protein